MLKVHPSSDGVAPRGALQPAPIRVPQAPSGGAVIPALPDTALTLATSFGDAPLPRWRPGAELADLLGGGGREQIHPAAR